MPTPTQGLIRVTLSGTYLGNNWANVYYYWNADAGTVMQKVLLADSFNAQVANRLATLMSDKVTLDQILIQDVLGITNDWAQPPTDTTGNLTGDALSRFVCFVYRYTVFNKETRVGFKRYVGVVEGDQADGSLTPTALSRNQAEESSFFQPITNTTQSYQPVIYGGPTPSQPMRSVVNVVTGITALQTLSTQNSRK